MNGRTNALVLSGGGSKGAFSVGAIEYMIDHRGLSFDIVTGTSTGALISPLVAAGGDEWRALKEIYTSVKTGDVIVRRRLHSIINSISVYKTDPLTKLIKQYLTPERVEMILQSQTMMFITGVCLQTGRLCYFQTGPRDGVTDKLSTIERIRDFDGLARAILASANQPVLTPPVKIPKSGSPLRQFVDGGVKEYAPFKIAIDNGATDIYAVLLSPAPEGRRKETGEYRKVVPILVRTIDMLVDDVAENDLKVARIFNAALDYIDG
ncbi:MAG: patatin-like phospholipase family protein, partial [Gemmatimonadota bacterium]